MPTCAMTQLSRRSPATPEILWFLLIAATNCGGATDSEAKGEGATLDGGGGTTGTTGTVGTAGGKSGGQAVSEGGSASLTEDTDPCAGPNPSAAPDTDGCRSSAQCGSGQFCDLSQCSSPCGCVGGSYTCANMCVSRCKSSACTAPSQAFHSQIQRECDLVVRVNADATSILSYRFACGAGTEITRDEALRQLLIQSRINWSESTAYGDSKSGYLFVHENPYDIIAFGPITYRPIFEVAVTGGADQPLGDWLPGTDIDGSCPDSATYGFETLGPWDSQDPGDAIARLLQKSGLFYAFQYVGAELKGVFLARAASSPVEYFVIMPSAMFD